MLHEVNTRYTTKLLAILPAIKIEKKSKKTSVIK